MKDPARRRFIITWLKCLLGFHYWSARDIIHGVGEEWVIIECWHCGKLKIDK